MRAEAERFAAAILDGVPVPTARGDAVANLRVIERLFAAAVTADIERVADPTWAARPAGFPALASG